MNKRALISVFDKTGIAGFTKSITDLGWEIISTGGTAKVLEAAEISIIPIEEITGNPECFDGRMKTLSFEIEAAILFDRRNSKHVKEARRLRIKPIDMVVCNLYPFGMVTAQKDCSLEEAIESIDIGGVTIIRAAAKNYRNVIVVSKPNDYDKLIDLLTSQEDISEQIRLELARKAFDITAQYDISIASFLKNMN